LAEAAYVIVYRSGVLLLPSVTAAGFGSPEMVGDVLLASICCLLRSHPNVVSVDDWRNCAD
jgi:hypothetical protein